MAIDFQSFASGVAAAKSAVELAASALNLITDSTKREAAKNALEQSKRLFTLAEVQTAEQLDYPLCRCEFPPVICTRNSNDRYVCAKCGKDNTPQYGSVARSFGY